MSQSSYSIGSHIQADHSTFNSVGRDQYNAGRDQYNTQYNISNVTGMNDQSPSDPTLHLKEPGLRFLDKQELVNWISPLNFNEQQDAAFGKRTKGTGTWLLQSSQFKDWMVNTSRVLWCPGKRQLLSL